MIRIDSDTTLAALVTERPDVTPVLEDLGLDYCCGGQRQLAEAAAEVGLDPEAMIARFDQTPRSDEPVEWAGLGLTDLVAHIEATHHVYLRAALVRLDGLAEKVLTVHGERHSELSDVRALVAGLRSDLEPHMLKEEQVLFPMIRELADATVTPDSHCGTLHNPVGMMTIEHERVGELLAQLRVRTDGYAVPDDGCASYRAFYAGLEELEADTHLHVHKENNLLFPAVLAAEQVLVAAGRL